MINIAIFGPPGAGKGTQSEYLTKEYDLFHISTGDILRKEIKDKTKLGLEVKEVIDSGKLVSDELILNIIEKTMADHNDKTGFLFDGFPRTEAQAIKLDDMLHGKGEDLACLLNLKVDPEISVQRLLTRAEIEKRSDDNEAAIRKRLKEYREKTLPVLDHYRKIGIEHDINGVDTIENVTQSIKQVLDVKLEKIK